MSGYDRDLHMLTHNQICDYVMKIFNQVKDSNDINRLVHFQSTNKFLFLAHDPSGVRILGRIVANKDRLPTRTVITIYERQIVITLRKHPTTKTHSNAIQKILGYFKKDLSTSEKNSISQMMSDYRLGRQSLESILLFLGELTHKLEKTYLVRQTYFLLYTKVRLTEDARWW